MKMKEGLYLSLKRRHDSENEGKEAIGEVGMKDKKPTADLRPW
jgi:hypothetical protein